MKILCPFHQDTNPSMHCYEEYSHCFTCGARARTEDVLNGEELKAIKREPTNISEVIERIQRLPKKIIRGLELPFDELGYYILYPEFSYYRIRLFEGRSKYIGPRGAKPPVFIAARGDSNLIIVEGELNALSLAESKATNATIVSQGSATNSLDYISFYLNYSLINVIMDKDKPGVAWGWRLKQQLLKHGKKVHLEALEKDFNQVLQDEGKEGVRKLFYERVGMLGGLQTG